MNYSDHTLLLTKLHRPRLLHDLIQRSRLVEILNRNIDHPLILVCAPAGFGKSILVSSWLEGLAARGAEILPSLPSAWLSLDENDSDLNLFLHYFIAALRTIYSEACAETLALLQARQQPPQAALYAALSNELEQLPGDCILVLDDYHTIHNVDVHNLLGEWVRHWPKPLHLVLISRINPPIPLDRMRAKGILDEIRTRDLRFTPQETVTYLDQSRLAPLTREALPLLEDRFEGWPAGLHLAALSLRSEGSQESVLAVLSSQNPNVTSYLVDEVVNHQPPAVRSFLLKTSILDRFCTSLCEAMLGEVDPSCDARACLDWIERSEMFIVSLDNDQIWYRYHHLFQELLQQRLSAEMTPEQIKDLHLLASAWLEEHGLLDPAIQHALAAGSLDLAARQMNTGLCDALNREDRQTLERWLRLLPEEMVQKRADLMMIRAWALQFTWRLDLQAQALRQVEELLSAGGNTALPANDLLLLGGQILTIRSQGAYFNNQISQAIDLCRQALAILPPAWIFARGGAMMYLGMAMQANGQAQEAEQMLLAEYETYGEKTDSYALFLLLSLGFIYLNTGQLEKTRQIAQVLLQGSTRSGIAIMKNWGDWFLGVVHFQWNELDAAAQHFTQIFENRFTAQIAAYRDAIAGLVLIHHMRGESSKAWEMVESISLFDLELKGNEDERTRSLRARLLLLQGDLEGAVRWADAITAPPVDQPVFWFEEPQITRVRILIARGMDADLHLAIQVLDFLNEITERTHNLRYKIEITALRALALDALGKTDQADSELKRMLDLARPGGFLRVFIDLGQPMQAMLRRLVSQGHPVGTIKRILAAFPEDHENLARGESSQHPGRYAISGNLSLIEPLTPRELEILNLMQGPLSVKEIALKLNISYPTAKRHTINIYAKLGVNRRMEAVARAEKLNVLPTR